MPPWQEDICLFTASCLRRLFILSGMTGLQDMDIAALSLLIDGSSLVFANLGYTWLCSIGLCLALLDWTGMSCVEMDWTGLTWYTLEWFPIFLFLSRFWWFLFFGFNITDEFYMFFRLIMVDKGEKWRFLQLIGKKIVSIMHIFRSALDNFDSQCSSCGDCSGKLSNFIL